MRIVHWDEMFHPDFGYQINVLTKYQVNQGHEVIIVTSQNIENHPVFKGFAENTDIEKSDELFTEKYRVRIIRVPIYGVYSGRVIYKPGYVKRVEDLNPDIMFCHTHDTFSGIYFTLHSKKSKFPIIFDSHMLEMASANPFNKVYRFLFKKIVTPAIVKNKNIIIKTQDDDYVNSCLGIPYEQTPYISFGTDTELFTPNSDMNIKIRNELDIDLDAFVITYAGKLKQSKGIELLVDTVLGKIESERNIVFVIIGNPNDEKGYEAEEKMKQSENTIIRFSTQKYEDLTKFYQISDLCLFPKQCSLSFFDVQSCGVPVLSEGNNINSERVGHNNGFTFLEDSVEDFRRMIQLITQIKQEEYNEMKKASRDYIIANFDYKEIAERYTDILVEEHNRFHNNLE